MKLLDEASQNVENVLRESYHDKESTEVDSRWKMNVMRQVRQRGVLKEKSTWSFFVNQFGWRFAAVVCTLVLIVFVYAGFSGFNPADEIRNLFLTNPVELAVAQMFL